MRVAESRWIRFSGARGGVVILELSLSARLALSVSLTRHHICRKPSRHNLSARQWVPPTRNLRFVGCDLL